MTLQLRLRKEVDAGEQEARGSATLHDGGVVMTTLRQPCDSKNPSGDCIVQLVNKKDYSLMVKVDMSALLGLASE